MNISVIVPSIREASLLEFRKEWAHLLIKHGVDLVIVKDGEIPVLEHNGRSHTVKEIMGSDSDLIYNFNDGVRNLGFAYVAKCLPDTDVIISLDDDTKPLGDTIQDHLDALDQKVPISWMSTASDYMRGFPYCVRDEAEVVLSHGVWRGVADWDAPTQLVRGNRKVDFYRGVIPKGVFYPHCAMNFAFKRKLLPYVYQAPAYDEYQRFSDIWFGIFCKQSIDKNNWAVVTGYSSVLHERASNVFTNLKKEATGLEANERIWNNDFTGHEAYFEDYALKRERWEKLIKSWVI